MKHYETDILTSKFNKKMFHGSPQAMPVYYTAAYEFPNAKAMEDAFCGRSLPNILIRAYPILQSSILRNASSTLLMQ